MRILVLGGGGHGQVVADILRAQSRANASISFAGYLDDRADELRLLLGEEVRGTMEDANEIEHDALIVAIGQNRLRQRFFELALRRSARFAVAIHPSAIVAPDASLRAGTVICAGAVIGTMAELGANTIVNMAASVDHHNRIGTHVHIAPGVRLGGEVTVGEGAFIGMGALVLPGRTIGPWAIVGAGAVVVDDVPPGAAVVGAPARQMTGSPT